MALKLMYITNIPDVATIADENGVDCIFIDMEYIGKDIRQAGMNTVKSHHTVDDVRNIRRVLKNAELLVRVNPMQPKNGEFDSKAEIDSVIAAGADIVMLPMYRRTEEVKRFINIVDGRAKTMLLAETAEAYSTLSDTVKLKGIDSIHIGLNDLHLALKKIFMFELLTDGTVDNMCNILKSTGIMYGFGGIARLGHGMLPAEYIIKEHYRLGSKMAILSRSFCDVGNIQNFEEASQLFNTEIKNIRLFERTVARAEVDELSENHRQIEKIIKSIVLGIGDKQ